MAVFGGYAGFKFAQNLPARLQDILKKDATLRRFLSYRPMNILLMKPILSRFSACLLFPVCARVKYRSGAPVISMKKKKVVPPGGF